MSFESDFHSALIYLNNNTDDANAVVVMYEKAVTLTLDKHALLRKELVAVGFVSHGIAKKFMKPEEFVANWRRNGEELGV